MSGQQILTKVSRNKEIFKNCKSALIWLDNFSFVAGQYVLARYYKNTEKTKIDSIVAIGLKNGVGRDYYQIISTKNTIIVNGVLEELPDVSTLYTNKTFLVKDGDDIYLYYYDRSGSCRNREKITGPQIYENIENGTTVYIGSDNVLRVSSDLVSKQDLNSFIKSVNGVSPDSDGNVTIEIPQMDLTEYATKSYVDEAIAQAQLGGDDSDIDLSAYLKKTDAASTYQPKGNYLTEVPSGYVTETELASKGYITDVSEKADKSSLSSVATSGSYNDLSDKPTIPSTEGLISKTTADATYQPKGSYITEIPSEYITETELEEKGYITDISGLQPKGDYVKTISVNSGEKQTIDTEGNINLVVSTAEDTRLTSDMIEYLNSKLAYTYGYTYSISANPSSLDLPSSTTAIAFTASFAVSKKNDSGSKTISLTSVESSTSGWTKSGNTYTKSVDIDSTATSCSSGTITATVTNSDGKSGTATGSQKTVYFTKPWFVFETSENTLSDPGQTVKDLISGDMSNLKTDRKAVTLTNTSVTVSKSYVWFAIPNTRTMGDVNQIAGLSSLESTTAKYTPSDTGLGTYSIYRWGGGLSAGTLTFNLTIK